MFRILKKKTMKKLFKYLYYLSLTMIFLPSCKDIIEDDLEGKNVVLTAPKDCLKTEALTQVFWWEEVEGALKYNFQIVSPSFTNVQELVIDSNTIKTQYQFTLHPGTYQWRVRAFNGSSTTLYTTYNLIIDSTANLSSQQVVLITPTNGFATTQTSLTFKWYELYNANDYRFELHSPDWEGELVYNPEIIDGTELTLTLTEGSYMWGVQAQNSSSSSMFTTRSLIIDLTNPSTPQLISPANADTITDSSINFSWTRGSNSGSSISDSLYVASDSTFTNLKLNTYLTDTTYTWTSAVTGTYFWKVKSIDAAGNKSAFSSKYKFKFTSSK